MALIKTGTSYRRLTRLGRGVTIVNQTKVLSRYCVVARFPAQPTRPGMQPSAAGSTACSGTARRAIRQLRGRVRVCPHRVRCQCQLAETRAQSVRASCRHPHRVSTCMYSVLCKLKSVPRPCRAGIRWSWRQARSNQTPPRRPFPDVNSFASCAGDCLGVATTER